MGGVGELAGASCPVVSVVIPTYNRAHCLPRSLESVLRQTFSDIEVIVVDDCSTDDTQAYLKSIDDSRLRVLRHDVNKGGSAARNTGIAAARAELIAFQDSDDEWLVTKLACQMQEYRKVNSPEYGAVYCGKVTYGEAGMRRYGPRTVYYAPGPQRNASGDILQELLREPMVSTQTLLVRKDLLDRIGGFDDSLKIGQDWDLTTRLARITKYIFIEEPLGMCFIEPDSISKAKINQVWMRQNMLDKNIDLISQDQVLYADYLTEIARVYQRNKYWRESLPFAKSALKVRPLSKRAWATLTLGSAMAVLSLVGKNPATPGQGFARKAP